MPDTLSSITSAATSGLHNFPFWSMSATTAQDIDHSGFRRIDLLVLTTFTMFDYIPAGSEACQCHQQDMELGKNILQVGRIQRLQ